MPLNSRSIVGSGNNREENDFYPTPKFATKALFRKEKFIGNVLEPACGNGAMSKVIKKYNKCISYDLIDRGYGNIKDFLKDNFNKYDNIITNPPYKYAKKFILKSKQIANKKIAMLCKLVLLEGIGRYKMFKDKKFPLKSVYVFCRRLKIYKNGLIGKNAGLIAYAWFIWDKDYKGKPKIGWIK